MKKTANKKPYEFILGDLIEEVDDNISYFVFLKQYLIYTSCTNYVGNYLRKEGKGKDTKYYFRAEKEKKEVLTFFPFLKGISGDNSLAKLLWKEYRNDSFEIFPFNWIKNNKLKEGFYVDKENLEKMAGISSNEKLNEYIFSLVPFSFALQVQFTLLSPYYSHDDDNFYLIQNPILKEKVFKVPMIRGSGWKGAIAKAFRDIINEKTGADKQKAIKSFMRIFGTGSDEFRKMSDEIKKVIKRKKDKESFEEVGRYLVFELGLKLTGEDIERLKSNPDTWLNENLFGSRDEILPYLEPYKGRAIFYPTYFDKLSLEIINPHSRKTRAGTNPIYYEVVPEGSKGTLQIIYIPYDGILKEDEQLKMEVEDDIELLTQSIERVADMGIGAKRKLGWGRFELVKKMYCVNKEIDELNLENWNSCDHGKR